MKDPKVIDSVMACTIKIGLKVIPKNNWGPRKKRFIKGYRIIMHPKMELTIMV